MSKLIVPAFLLALLASTPLVACAEDDLVAESGPKLKLYGYADFTIRYSPVESSNAWYKNSAHTAVGTIGNLNLYLDSQLSQRVRSLVEVRFTYAPNGSLTVPDGNGGTYKGSTSVSDYGGNYNGTFTWGGVDIERAWIEYTFSDLLRVRAGEFLTPYGIWNVDHGTPTLVGTKPPYIIGQEWFPRHQMGGEVLGSRYLGNTRVGYHLTVSNGRIGNNPETAHTNSTPGLGGRVFAEGEGFGTWAVGASTYHGQYTEVRTTTASGTTTTSVMNDYREHVYGVDASWKLRNLKLVAEGIYSSLDYTRKVPKSVDLHRYGWYALAAYDLPYGLTAWTQFDASRASNHSGSILCAAKLGLNKQVVPGFVLKASANRLWYENNATNHDSAIEYVGQAAWAF